MSSQTFNREKVDILLKRAKEYTIKETDTEEVKAHKQKIHDKILLDGEPLYLVDIDALVIGNGKLYKNKSSNPANWTVEGSTVEELINSREYFSKNKGIKLLSNVEKSGEEITIKNYPTLEYTPIAGDSSNNISDTSFVSTAVENSNQVFFGTSQPTLPLLQKYPIIWVDTSATDGAHVIKVKYSAATNYVSLYDNVKLTNKPYLDSTPEETNNSNLIATTAFVVKALSNGAEIFFGDATIENEIALLKTNVNQKYPVIYARSFTVSGKANKLLYVIYKNNSGEIAYNNLLDTINLSGDSTATTASTNDSSTKIATTQFVWNAINTLDVSKLTLAQNETLQYIQENNGKIGVGKQYISLSYDEITNGNTYTKPLPSNSNPKMDGTVAVGTSTKYSREDHVHPSDSTKEDKTNKISAWNTTPDNSHYPSELLVKNYIDTVAGVKTNSTNKTLYIVGVEKPSSGSSTTGSLYYNTSGTNNTSGVRINCSKGVLMGAAWNDFAEFRQCETDIPGTVVCETGNGDLKISHEKMQAGACVISDTYGMVIGKEEKGYSPIAVAGRVLVKYNGDIKNYTAGAAVCADCNGCISLMSREEIMYYPDRILGYVSELPKYNKWNDIEVNDRIWIKVK